MNRSKCWFTIVLLNVISIIVHPYGTFDNSYANLLINCEKLPLYIIRIHKLMEMVYRIRNGMCPEYIQKFIVFKDNNFNLRAYIR